jgi:hypothetical protein
MYYAIKRWLKWELPNYPRVFVEGVRNLIRWFPIVWKDRDWDTHYIWQVLKFKIKNQAKYIGEKDRHMSAKRDSEKMNLCVSLMDKIQNEYYSSEYHDYQDNKFHWDDCKDMSEYCELRIEELSENLDEYFKKYPLIYKKVVNAEKNIFRIDDKRGIAMNIGHINHQRAKKLLFNILENNIECWWD